MRHRHILTCFFLLTFVPLSVKAFPPASPAGGNYLALDGIDDYAVLDFKTFGTPLPDGTDEFTFEAWVYPIPQRYEKNTSWPILHQQARMVIVNDELQPFLNGLANAWNIDSPEGDLILLMSGYFHGKLGRSLPFSFQLAPNQWHHIALQSNGQQVAMIVNDLVRIWPHELLIGQGVGVPRDFVLGGFGEKVRLPVRGEWFWGSFAGYIDEVRISEDVRYDVEKKGFTPRDAFKNDVKTVALWHFDEPGGAVEFSDVSGNEYHLSGQNGAKTSIPLAVEADGKLTTTWGRLKQSNR